jgi:hypothetical protein
VRGGGRSKKPSSLTAASKAILSINLAWSFSLIGRRQLAATLNFNVGDSRIALLSLDSSMFEWSANACKLSSAAESR